MGKGDKKSKRGKIITGSYGVRRLRRKKKGGVPEVKRTEEKPKMVAAKAEEPVAVPAVIVEQPLTEAKKTAKKAPAKKAVSGEEVVKPKVAKTKKKTVPETETLFSKPEETTPE